MLQTVLIHTIRQGQRHNMISKVDWKTTINIAIRKGKFPYSVTNHSCRWQSCAVPEIFGPTVTAMDHFQAFVYIRACYGQKVIELGRDFNVAVLDDHPKEAHRIYKELEAIKNRMGAKKKRKPKNE